MPRVSCPPYSDEVPGIPVQLLQCLVSREVVGHCGHFWWLAGDRLSDQVCLMFGCRLDSVYPKLLCDGGVVPLMGLQLHAA